MRAGLQDAEFLIYDDQFVGVNLGWDCISEHECGIKGIKAAFDMPEKPGGMKLGFDARKISKCPKDLVLRTSGSETYLAYVSMIWDDKEYETKEYERRIMCENYRKDKELYCGWSDRDFGIRVTTKKNAAYLQELYNAFQEKDVVIFLGHSGPFSNGGLKICIMSRLPKEAVAEAKEIDKDAIRLKEAAEKTGIVKRLQAVQDADDARWDKRCSYFALSPRWATDGFNEIAKRTKHDVVFWLNPKRQRENNSCWCTVEDLDLWIEGKGPIPKTKGS